jgi:hypothetical protein
MSIYLEALIWLFLSIFLGAESVQLGLGKPVSPGPGFIPFLLALCLFVLSSLLIFRASSLRTGLAERPRLRASVFYVTGSIILYVFLFKRLGYLLATFLLMGFLFRTMGTRRWRWVIGGAFLATSLTYFFFGIVLNLSLPSGLMGK